MNQWDQYADLYDRGIGECGDALHTQIIDPVIFDFLGDSKGKNILDLGCGNGYLTKRLAQTAKQVVGCDSSTELLQKAKAKINELNVDFVSADVTKALPFPDSQFEVVIANMVIQYLPDLTIFAPEVARVLSSKGIFIAILDHPSHALFLRAQELAGKKNEKFLTSASYFSAGKRTKKSLWDKAILEYYHRPMMFYLNAFAPYLRLEKVEEKTEDGEMPRILGMKWRN